ncbi:putative multisubunit sodium/proton antiporter MrpA subunit [Clostridium aceticum]|uniref:Putative multisubunit sodium/proton antiporter MrpA subunit n=1 Tax=Clostridium aceticum TaxID=84022 RepID=A0A0D8IB85_9CLOT|nr:hydrogenase subunit MbhD domain-containing protein [Clostridium aceticum]AKL96775.1 putative multisubunit sodium/proton antiporter MrpA subunit [Clostridium aceticum]KJF27533.1 cation:proton antiporter [Clostridium aceticum]
MEVLNIVLIIFLIGCAIAVERTKDLLSAVIIFGAYSLTMAILWLILRAPDIALTEAAIGAGATTILLIATISRTRRSEK